MEESNTLHTPAHILRTLTYYAMVTEETSASPLDYDSTFPVYWSPWTQDRVFGANIGMFESKFTGFSFCHLPHDDKLIYHLIIHALSSIANTNIPTATFPLLPSPMGWTKKRHMHWLRCFSDHAAVPAKFS
eukprot:1160080-Pelagomonas_calceolata.AAC.19